MNINVFEMIVLFFMFWLVLWLGMQLERFLQYTGYKPRVKK